MDPIKVGNFIASLRRANNLTQEELAERLNVSNKTVSKWEVGTNIPDTNCLFKLSKEFNVPTQDILNGGEVHNESENNDSINKGINFYNKLFKRKVTKIVILIIIAIVTLFSVLYTISNYNRVQVYDIISKDDNFRVHGYLIHNPSESIFIINNIKYFGNDKGTIDESNIWFYNIYINSNNTESYYLDEEALHSPQNISELLNKISLSFILNNQKNNILDNIFYLNMRFINENNYTYTYKIELRFEKYYTNTKIVY